MPLTDEEQSKGGIKIFWRWDSLAAALPGYVGSRFAGWPGGGGVGDWRHRAGRPHGSALHLGGVEGDGGGVEAGLAVQLGVTGALAGARGPVHIAAVAEGEVHPAVAGAAQADHSADLDGLVGVGNLVIAVAGVGETRLAGANAAVAGRDRGGRAGKPGGGSPCTGRCPGWRSRGSPIRSVEPPPLLEVVI